MIKIMRFNCGLLFKMHFFTIDKLNVQNIINKTLLSKLWIIYFKYQFPSLIKLIIIFK